MLSTISKSLLRLCKSRISACIYCKFSNRNSSVFLLHRQGLIDLGRPLRPVNSESTVAVECCPVPQLLKFVDVIYYLLSCHKFLILLSCNLRTVDVFACNLRLSILDKGFPMIVV